MPLYLETSALLTWLLGEPDARAVARTVDAAEHVVSSVLTVTEASRGLVRAEQLGRIRASERARLRATLGDLAGQWSLMEVTSEVRARAEEPFPVEPVRTLDALHLATATLLRQAYPTLEVFTLDHRVAENALALGIPTRSHR